MLIHKQSKVNFFKKIKNKIGLCKFLVFLIPNVAPLLWNATGKAKVRMGYAFLFNYLNVVKIKLKCLYFPIILRMGK